MSAEKNPFKGLTIAEVMAAEASSYVIQVGKDFFCYKGQYAFSERSAIVLYNKILANLIDLIKNGNDKQREDALKCIVTLKVYGLRIN